MLRTSSLLDVIIKYTKDLLVPKFLGHYCKTNQTKGAKASNLIT